jgi:hypothetical protein
MCTKDRWKGNSGDRFDAKTRRAMQDDGKEA